MGFAVLVVLVCIYEMVQYFHDKYDEYLMNRKTPQMIAREEVKRCLGEAVEMFGNGDENYYVPIAEAVRYARRAGEDVAKKVSRVGAGLNSLDILRRLNLAAEEARVGEDFGNTLWFAKSHAKGSGLDVNEIAGVITEFGNRNCLDKTLSEMRQKAERGGDYSSLKQRAEQYAKGPGGRDISKELAEAEGLRQKAALEKK